MNRRKMMRTVLCTLLGVTFMAGATQAQLPGMKKDILSAASPGSLITQFAGALKPASFTDAWSGEKEGFMSKAKKVSDAVSMANTLSTLAGFIKPSLFKEGVSAGSLLQTANKAKTIAQAASLLKSFEGGLKPEAFVDGWSGQRSSWLSALTLLK